MTDDRGGAGTADEHDDLMAAQWCCLSCREKFRFGQLIGSDTLRCPHCNSDCVMRADGECVVATQWNGEPRKPGGTAMKITAQVVSWSSVVGTGLMLLNDNGACIGQLSLHNVQLQGDIKTISLAMIESVAAKLNSLASLIAVVKEARATMTVLVARQPDNVPYVEALNRRIDDALATAGGGE